MPRLFSFVRGGPRATAWYNEGLAECYSGFRADDKTAWIGVTQNEHVLFLKEHDLLPLHDLFAITHDSPDYNEGERRGIFYAESWAFMHYVMWDKPERKPQYLRFLDALDRDEPPDSAFPASFGTSYQAFENELKLYVRQNRFMMSVYKISDLGLDDTVNVSPMKREEVLCRLGDLLAHIDENRASEAEELFREAQRLAPAYPAANAGLAYMAQIGGRFDDAIGLYEKAIELAPNDPLTFFHLGQRLARRAAGASPNDGKAGPPPDLVRAEDMFGQAIQLRHDFGEAYVEYAKLIFEMGIADKAAIPLFEAARVLLPSRVDVVVNLAILYAQTGQTARAHDTVEDVLAHMNDRDALAFARTQIQRVNDRRAGGSSPAAPDQGGAPHRAVPEANGTPPDDSSTPTTGVPPSDATAGFDGEPTAIYNEHVAIYNQAVGLANRRDYKGAVELLEKLVGQVHDRELRARITSFLAQLRKDAARLQKGSG